MSKKTNDYEILMTEQGFYFGRLLKNGTMSADSTPIDDEQITNLVAAWFERHCQRETTDQLWISKPDGAILVKQFTAEQLRDAATEAAKKADKAIAQQPKNQSRPQPKKPARGSEKKPHKKGG